MKKLLALLWVVCVCNQFGVAQNIFQKTFGYLGGESASSIQQTADGGFIIAGSTNSFGAGNDDILLIKTDVNGVASWEKTYGGTDMDRGTSVRQTSDGGYIIAGYTSSFGAGFNDVYLIKTNANGDTLWTKTYGGLYDDGAYSVQQTSDGGYIMTGFTISFGAGDVDVYLLKTDSIGNLLWTRSFGGIELEQGMEVKQTIDGGYIIAGYTLSFGSGGTCGSSPCSDVYIIKTDLNGVVEWTKTFSGTEKVDEDGRSIQQTADGGYVILGTAYTIPGLQQVYLLKTNSLGDIEWSKTYGSPNERDGGYSIQQTFDSGYIICGYTSNLLTSSWYVYLLKTDTSGAIEWGKKYGGADADYGYSVQQMDDGGYIRDPLKALERGLQMFI